MCGLYGVLSYGNEIKDIEEIVQSLAFESAVRGTDATGISYNRKRRTIIVKQSKSAYDTKFKIPKDVSTVMGHTRHATQGTLKYNENNHPFRGVCGRNEFSLAHNGIIANDDILRREMHLPFTRIETDSYIAVQLLETQKQLDFSALRFMAEKVCGSFSFTVLDNRNNLYIVKGDSPVSLLHFPDKRVYVYASTPSILWKAVVDTELFNSLKNSRYEEVIINDGTIVRISAAGEIRSEHYDFDEFGSFGYDWRGGFGSAVHKEGNTYIDDLKTAASFYGYTGEDIDTLIKGGFTAEEVEDMLYYNGYLEV